MAATLPRLRLRAGMNGPVGPAEKIPVDVVDVFGYPQVAAIRRHSAGRVSVEDHPHEHLTALRSRVLDDRGGRQPLVILAMAAGAVDGAQRTPDARDAGIGERGTFPLGADIGPHRRANDDPECNSQAPGAPAAA